MNAALIATLTRTRTGEPLASVDGLPGGGADLTPAQLRALAGALSRIAADLEARPTAKKTPAARREYAISAAPAPCIAPHRAVDLRG